MEKQTQKIDENTSKRITALRFLLIVLVVFIHNNFKEASLADDFANGITVPLFNQGVFGKWLQLFISDGLARSAVPLFFLFASYLQAKKDDSYLDLLKKKAKSIFVPFVLWTTFYIVGFNGLKICLIQFAPSFVQHPDDTFLKWSARDWLYNVLGFFKFPDDSPNVPRIVFQFWFLRDLLILFILSPILKFFVKKYPAFLLFSVSFIYIIPLHVYFVDAQALFYYSLGLYWGLYDIPLFEKIDKIGWAESIATFLLSFFIAYRFFPSNLTVYWLMIFASCVLLLKLSAVITAHEKLFALASYLSDFSFFLFAFHTPFLQRVILKAWISFFPMKNQFFCIFEYFGVNILTVLIGTGIGISLKKISPRFFGFITGGRTEKAISIKNT